MSPNLKGESSFPVSLFIDGSPILSSPTTTSDSPRFPPSTALFPHQSSPESLVTELPWTATRSPIAPWAPSLVLGWAAKPQPQSAFAYLGTADLAIIVSAETPPIPSPPESLTVAPAQIFGDYQDVLASMNMEDWSDSEDDDDDEQGFIPLSIVEPHSTTTAAPTPTPPPSLPPPPAPASRSQPPVRGSPPSANNKRKRGEDNDPDPIIKKPAKISVKASSSAPSRGRRSRPLLVEEDDDFEPEDQVHDDDEEDEEYTGFEYSAARSRKRRRVSAESKPSRLIAAPADSPAQSRRRKPLRRKKAIDPSKVTVRCEYQDPTTNDVCSEPFARLYDLNRHMENVHGRDERERIARGELDPALAQWAKQDTEEAICWECNKVFSRKDALIRHLGTRHRGRTTSQNDRMAPQRSDAAESQEVDEEMFDL